MSEQRGSAPSSDPGAKGRARVREYYSSALESATAIWPDVVRVLEADYSDFFNSEFESAGTAQLALASIGWDLAVVKQKFMGDLAARQALSGALADCARDPLAYERVSLYARHFFNEAQRVRLDRPDAGFAYLTALGLEDTGFQVGSGDPRFRIAGELEEFAARISTYPDGRAR